MPIKNIMIDIDGTVSDDIPNEKQHLFLTADVEKDAVECVNKLYEMDDTHITFFTSRKEEHRKDTEEWLKNNGFKYHELLLNKPRGGNYIWIDNLDVTGIKYNNQTNGWKNILENLSNR
jgi:hypothetical protein